MSLNTRSFIIGIASLLPGVRSLSGRKTGGTVSARYCYTVWLRHLSMLHRHGLPTTFETVAELGPGDTLGTGLAALLCGAERYIGLDAVRYADAARNLHVLEDLIALFQDRAPIPDQTEFPRVQPPLPSYEFPVDLLTSARLAAALNPVRLDRIGRSVANPGTGLRDGPVSYKTPWTTDMIEDGSLDLVFSQGVLQFVEDLPGAYAAMARWLKPNGILSHETPFQSIGITTDWNGHWACSDPVWKLLVGQRRHATNREPHSTHIRLMKEAGFRIATEVRIRRPSAISRAQLVRRFRHLTDDDLTTSSSLIQAVKMT